MNLFSIAQLSKYSGIKSHTIRIWEQRYNALKPHRSEGNTRYYDNSQLRRLLNIVSLSGSGYRVSELCEMPDIKLFELVNDSMSSSIDRSGKSEYYVSQLIAAGMSYDEQHFEKIFSNCLLRFGMKETYTAVIYPMLVRIGLMWSGDTIPPANEHYISNLVRQKLFSAIDSLPPAKPGADKWILFLQENEFHELGLLFASYMIRLSGQQVVYLGADVPFESLGIAVKTIKPAFLLFFIVHKELPENIETYVGNTAKLFSGKKIFVAGDEDLLQPLKHRKSVQYLHSVQALETEINGQANNFK